MDARMLSLAFANGLYAFVTVVGFCAAALAAFSAIVILCAIISKIAPRNNDDKK